MNELALLADCLKRLNALPVDYYVTGSMASNFWGIPRTTHDLDFVIRIERSAIKPLVDAFRSDFYIDADAVQAAFSPPYQFNAIDTRSALKVDFWLPTPAAFDQENAEEARSAKHCCDPGVDRHRGGCHFAQVDLEQNYAVRPADEGCRRSLGCAGKTTRP